MPEVLGVEKLLSALPSKRFGKPRCYGRGMFAFSDYGADEIVCFPDRYDAAGQDREPKLEPIEFSGIYRRDNVTGEVKHYREPYYTPYNPRTVDQQAQRQKYADGVAAWQGLTQEQKDQYNINAKGKGMSGYNLFLKEYLLSH